MKLWVCALKLRWNYFKRDVQPVFRPKCPGPYGAIDMIDRELAWALQLGIISPDKYFDWATPVVVVRKVNDNIRIGADFSTVFNNVLEPHESPDP